jgi:hypothetical protein
MNYFLYKLIRASYKRRSVCLLLILILLVFTITSNTYRSGNESMVSFWSIENFFDRESIESDGDELAYEQSSVDNCLSAFENANSYVPAAAHRLAAAGSHPTCDNQDWILVDDNGYVTLNSEYLSQKQIVVDNCMYASINWHQNDFSYSLSKYKPINLINENDHTNLVNENSSARLDVDEEFFQVKCTSTNKEHEFNSAYARIFKKKIAKSLTSKKSKTSSNGSSSEQQQQQQPINVMFIGFDSVSREDWLSRLTRSSGYLLNELKSNVLHRYNIVGDGTPAALIPILTGRHEHEMPSTLKSKPSAQHVDKAYPFIWRNFSERLGYATLYGEDWPSIGTFQYRMIGMSRPPTLHYLRPFQLALHGEHIVGARSCMNGRTNLKLNLDYVDDFMRVYKQSGFFGFLFISEYSHDSHNHLTWIDTPLYEFLERFGADKQLRDSTILVLFSDHGPRFSRLRKSIRGLLQERNPFMSVYMPSLFASRYSKEHAQFIQNINKLVSPMDIHKTMFDLLRIEEARRLYHKRMRMPPLSEPPPPTPFNRAIVGVKSSPFKLSSMSMLSESIPANRTCRDAGISDHWCACLRRRKVIMNAKNVELLSKLANQFVEYLNGLLKEHTSLCHKLTLGKINSVYLMDSLISPRKANVAFKYQKQRQQSTNLRLLTPPRIEIDYKQYFMQVTTTPNDGVYEFTTTAETRLSDNRLYNSRINENAISRINEYGNAPACVENEHPHLRKYCFCRSFNATKDEANV